MTMDDHQWQRFVIAFSAAQHYADRSAAQDLLLPFAIAQVREELENAFDALPEQVRLAITQVRDMLKIDRPAPEVRKVTSSD